MRELISLSNLLLEENKLTREQSERIAQEWIQDIVDDFGRSGSSDISGLGTFRQRKIGAIFTPDDGLALAILLPPIPGFSQQLESAPEPIATNPVEPEVADEPAPTAAMADPEESNIVDSEPEIEAEPTPAAAETDPEEEAATSKTESAPEVETEVETEEEPAEEAEAQVEAETDTETEADTVAKAKKAPRSRTPNRRPQGNPKAAMMIGSVIVLVGIFALIYVFAFQSKSSEIVLDQEVASTLAAEGEGIDDPSSSLDAGKQDDSASDDSSQQATPGLNPPPAEAFVDDNSATSFTRDTDGYTLMVGSVMTRAQAQGSIDSFSSLGLPLGVLEYQTDEVTRYRMGVGIFPTVESAVEALESMRGQLPAGTWVFRIR